MATQSALTLVTLTSHWDTLRAVMRLNGLPQNIVSLIKLFSERFECGLILREGVSDFFDVQTGVRSWLCSLAYETLECVDSITYLRSLISSDGSAQKDTKNRLNKARNTFSILRWVWRSSGYSIRTKFNR